jgi:uncharacterized protein YecT (DUF1311 family)
MSKIALTLFFLLLAGGAQAQLAVTDKAIARTGKLKLEIHYPETGRPDIDRIFAGEAQKYAADPDLNETSEGPNSGRMSYEIKRNDAQMFSVQVSTYSYYAGHAHGLPEGGSYNFLMPGGQQVYLPELVDGRRGMEKISRLVIADIQRQDVAESGKSRPLDELERSAGPDDLAYIRFAWLPQELVLEFGSYQLNGYAGGPTVHIPLSALADVIRPDPLAPSPSFDCRIAKSTIEKSICGDVELARLDRQVADYYAGGLSSRRYAIAENKGKPREAEKIAALTAYISEQRDWLKLRNATCEAGDKACLAKSYRDRLKANLF